MEAVGPRRWFFDAWSLFYDAPWVQRATYWPIHDAVIEALGARPARILDLGCGTGQLAARLATRFPRAEVVGCDFSAGMLRRAAVRSSRVLLVQGDGCQLPFAEGVFDAIVCTEAFHWFPDQNEALAECFRVLRPGGRLLLAVVTTPAAAVSRIIHLGSRVLGEPMYWPSRAESRRWFTAAGFRIEDQRHVSRIASTILPPILTVAVRPAARSRSPHPLRRRLRAARAA